MSFTHCYYIAVVEISVVYYKRLKLLLLKFGVSITNYYGFAILLININNSVTLNNVNITFTSGSA